MNGGSGRSGNDYNDSLSAFIASPVFGRVAAAVPTAVTAGPLFNSPRGLPCQTMTQTITIDRQEVHAAAVLCRQPNGTWRIDPTQNAHSGIAAP